MVFSGGMRNDRLEQGMRSIMEARNPRRRWPRLPEFELVALGRTERELLEMSSS